MKKDLLSLLAVFSLLISAPAQEAIHNVARAGNLDSLKKLLKADPALLNKKDKTGLSPLHYASTASLEVVTYLVEQGADVNAKSNSGSTPLYSAARFGQTAIAKYLLEHKADINAKSDGGSPMHQAVYRAPKELIELFLSYHPDVTIKDNQGQTALLVAATWNAKDILPLLISAGWDINAKDLKGNTALHLCLTFMDAKSTYVPEVANILISNKALLNERNSDGLTPLGLAIKNGAVDMIKTLREAGALEN